MCPSREDHKRTKLSVPSITRRARRKESKTDAILDSMGKQRWRSRTDGKGLRNNLSQSEPVAGIKTSGFGSWNNL